MPKTIQDLPPVICTAEEGGEYSDLGRRLIDLEVEDKTLAGHGLNAGSHLRVFGASVGMGCEFCQNLNYAQFENPAAHAPTFAMLPVGCDGIEGVCMPLGFLADVDALLEEPKCAAHR